MTDTADVLRKARALIEEPDHWIKVYGCTDRAGNPVEAYSEAACCFCIWGALSHVTKNTFKAHELAALVTGHPYEDKDYYTPWVDWNDAPERTHSEVLAAFDKAIALAEQDQS